MTLGPSWSSFDHRERAWVLAVQRFGALADAELQARDHVIVIVVVESPTTISSYVVCDDWNSPDGAALTYKTVSLHRLGNQK